MDSNIFKLSIDNTANIPVVIGTTCRIKLNLSNISSNIYIYNINIYLTLPDGLSVSEADLQLTSSALNNNGTTTYSWINLKDLAPAESNYQFNITLKCNATFKDNTYVPFGNLFNCAVHCSADTCPRGNYDIQNISLSSDLALTIKACKFSGSITVPAKVLKGAGTALTSYDYTRIYSASCVISNNYISSSIVNISILLDDGIRYLGNIACSGKDSNNFSSPIVSSVIINNSLYTMIYYSFISLSPSSINTITFDYAVWNKYKNNTGDLIPHGTNLEMKLNIASDADTIDTSCIFSALDLLINMTNSKNLVDVDDSLQYTYSIKTGQYYNIYNCDINSFLPDGIIYVSSSDTPNSVINDSSIEGTSVYYSYPILYKNTNSTLTATAKVAVHYSYKQNITPIASFDNFTANALFSGKIAYLASVISDFSATSCLVPAPLIKKEFIKAYYRNGTAKTFLTLAPYDYAEYLLTYNPNSLRAVQKDIYIYDFFPLMIENTEDILYKQTGFKAGTLTPLLITSNGVQFYYGDYNSNSISTITVKAPIDSLEASNGFNFNLFKMKGKTSSGYSYSLRSQIAFNLGSPNITLTKSVTGLSKSAIKVNEVYMYTIKITNSNTLGTETDAFNFNFSDELSIWFTLNLTSLKISGIGMYSNLIITPSAINMNINKLAPGQYLTLTYSVTLNNIIPPALTIKTACSTSNPYSQETSSYQYADKSKTASVSIASENITISQTINKTVFQVGSSVCNTINVTFPKGTICYEVCGIDTLPSGGQSLINIFKNNLPITASVSKNVITLPSEGTIDSRSNAVTLTYTLNSKIITASKTVGAITSVQTNNFKINYKQSPTSNTLSLSNNTALTVNHPNIVMNLNCKNADIDTSYTANKNIDIYTPINYRLNFINNSVIKLENGIIKIPIPSNLIYVSIDNEEFCHCYYDTKNSCIMLNISELNASASGYISFTLVPLTNLKAGTSITTTATANQYYNELLSKLYSGETSNSASCNVLPGCSLSPDTTHKKDDSTSFSVTPPGYTVSIINIFQNTGGGYDSYTLIIKPIAISYTLFIDNIKIADISPNTLFQNDLDIMKNVAPNIIKAIKLSSQIPATSPLGSRYDFIVTVRSKTSPYPEKTVTNIDPC